jgi:hypothetical protein
MRIVIIIGHVARPKTVTGYWAVLQDWMPIALAPTHAIFYQFLNNYLFMFKIDAQKSKQRCIK